MKQKFTLLAMLFIALPLYAQEHEKLFGAGIMIGEPTGATAQLRQSENLYELGIGISLNSETTIIADYKKIFSRIIPTLIRKPSSPVNTYAGFGFFAQLEKEKKYETKFASGIRFPLGMEWQPKAQPFGLFIDIAPTLKVITETDAQLMACFGGRYYF